MQHKVTVVLASSLAAVLSVFGVAVASGAAAEGHRGSGQGSRLVVGGSRAGNGSSDNAGGNAGPASAAGAFSGGGGRGGHGGAGGDIIAGRHGGGGGAGGAGGNGAPAGATSGAGGGGNAASQSGVSNSGDSANTNVTSANAQVNPEVSARNESANVVVAENDNRNVSVNGNENRNGADADANARAGNGNLNLNVGVNELANANGNGPPPPLAASRTLCESFGGRFFIGEQNLLWSCINLPFGASDPRALVLADACTQDGGAVLEFSELTPRNAHCLSVDPG